MSPMIDDDSDVLRIVFDTNVLIDSMQDPLGASARLLEAVEQGTVLPIATAATEREYQLVIGRLIERDEEQDALDQFLSKVSLVKPVKIEAVIDDEEDYKFLQAAVAGNADMLVTSDRHLLDVGEIEETRIVRPNEAIASVEDSSGSEWAGWAKGMGIG